MLEKEFKLPEQIKDELGKICQGRSETEKEGLMTLAKIIYAVVNAKSH